MQCTYSRLNLADYSPDCIQRYYIIISYSELLQQNIICIAKYYNHIIYIARLYWVYDIRIRTCYYVSFAIFIILFIGLTITNGPQNTTICMNANGEISCGFIGANPNLVIPDWRIITRNDNGSIVSNETLWGLNITRNCVSGLK